MKGKSYTVKELLDLLPTSLLDDLAAQTKVDYQVKKLTGKLVFQLLLYGFASQKELSWRILEQLFSHYHFQQFAALSAVERVDHSSLATRISKIEVKYFKKLYEHLCNKVGQEFATERIGGYRIIRFDSTLVSIAGTLLKKMDGLRHGVNTKRAKPSDAVDLKFTVGFDGLSPVQVDFFNQQTYLSEDVALKEVIDQYEFKNKDLAVFDRGLNRRSSLDEFTDQDLHFVTRMRMTKGKVKHELIRDFTTIDPQKPILTDTLRIYKDQLVYLFGKKNKKNRHPYRLIQAKALHSDQTYCFLTNEMELSVEEVVLIYKYRWDIEVFFKFLKQEFGFKHLLARNQNGIEVILYMTLITFTLIYLYYKFNKIESFKIAKLKFIQELEFDVLKLIVEFCQGDPNLLHLLKPF